MKLYAVNGSPRKKHNTATLLKAALEGAKAAHGQDTVETEIIHLNDLQYKTCQSCFACKRLGGKHYGHCAVKDDLAPVLQKLADADGIIFGSPIYFSDVTGMMRSFFERLLFPYLTYDKQYSAIAPKRMPTAFIYTMNLTEAQMEERHYKQKLGDMEFFIGHIFSAPEVMYANNTYQFDDYSKYKFEICSEAEKAAHRDKQFPLDKQNAAALGARLVERIRLFA